MDWELKFIPIDEDNLSRSERTAGNFRNSDVHLLAKIGMLPLSIKVKDIELTGLLRVDIRFGSVFPHIQVVNLAFLDPPCIDMKLKPLGTGDINSIKLISDSMESIVNSSLASFIVHPNYLPINVEEMMTAQASTVGNII